MAAPARLRRFSHGGWNTGHLANAGRCASNQDASLHFSVTDNNGQPLALEPYMGMLSHAAVLRRTTACSRTCIHREIFPWRRKCFLPIKGDTNDDAAMADMANMPGMDHTMHHMHQPADFGSLFALRISRPRKLSHLGAIQKSATASSPASSTRRLARR